MTPSVETPPDSTYLLICVGSSYRNVFFPWCTLRELQDRVATVPPFLALTAPAQANFPVVRFSSLAFSQ